MKTILECVVGSTLHGTSVDDGLEDLDLMSVVLESPTRALGFSRKDTWIERTKPDGVRSEAGDVDHSKYGLHKYLTLALKQNPTVLLALFAPPEAIRVLTPAGRALRELAPLIVAKSAYNPFRGYMHDQHKRLMGEAGQKNVTRPELIERHGFDTKYAGHIIRLGYQGAELLRTGRVTLPMPDHERNHVLEVRTGKFSLMQVSSQIEYVKLRLDDAHSVSTLREMPDYTTVEAWMVRAYLRWFSFEEY